MDEKRYALLEVLKQIPILRLMRNILSALPSIPTRDYFSLNKIFNIFRVYDNSMSGYRRLANVYDLAHQVEKEGIEGAFVECGVWRGGCIGLMASVAKEYGTPRRSVLFDSFEGLPEPTDKDGDEAKYYASGRNQGSMQPISRCVGPLQAVEALFFEKLKISRDLVMFKKGWFQDTVPGSGPEIGPIAILRLDGDWYESTKVCLENLFDSIVPGGFIIIDDYRFWEGCRKAVHEFFAQRGINPELTEIDEVGVYFRKSA